MKSKIATTTMALIVAGAAAAGCASWNETKTASNEPVAHRGPVQTVDDAAITAKVKAELAANAAVTARNIDVDTMRGFVTLYGDVHNPREAQEAIDIARGTSGVTGVTSHLRVIG